jgi:3-methyl-2-oxobutanoate hydroxymethyltransferase
MVVLGHATTLPVTLAEMIGHTQAVARGLRRPRGQQPLRICDLPFLSYQCGTDQAVAAAGRVLKESAAAAVKLEGGEPETVAVIDRLVRTGIPVMGHVGLRPQAVHQLGGYRMQRDAEALTVDAAAAAAAGAFAVVLECVPREIAASITRSLPVPTIGIGAGPDCGGQVLVMHDLVGLSFDRVPRFVRRYTDARTSIAAALAAWKADVERRDFPGVAETLG